MFGLGDWLRGLPRLGKAVIVVSIDVILAIMALAAAAGALTHGGAALYLWVALAVAGLSWWGGSARAVLSAMDMRDMSRIILVAGVVGVGLWALGMALQTPAPGFLAGRFFVLALALMICARVTAAALLRPRRRKQAAKKVIIYGAGSAGRQLQAAFDRSVEAEPVAFIDDNPAMQGVLVGGLKVYAPPRLEQLLASTGASQLLIAIPSLTSERRAEMLARLKKLPCKVSSLPSYVELMVHEGDLLSSLRPVELNGLLGRGAVEVDYSLIESHFAGKVALVSGAGGSIGSELCRQLTRIGVRRLVLFEMSEYALYAIEQELRKHAATVEIIPMLGSVCDRERVRAALREHDVEVVLHAAAYKHVPLVEANPLEGARNNVLGTHVMATEADAAGVERFILVSTDKAVRPTSVMGATKRLAELAIQDLQTRSAKTVFSMVRFGNVLGSSGSVIPLFKKQIAERGPVTVTAPEVTRYFMTIPEAVQLVLTAGCYAEGGEVFVLDMGKPVKIASLARRLIRMSGYTVRDEDNPNGDIEITYCGLRDGEKLYEELLISASAVVGTPHQKIFQAVEAKRSEVETSLFLKEIRRAVAEGRPEICRAMFTKFVEGYRSARSTKSGKDKRRMAI